MQEAFDNMPESLQGGDLGQRRQEAADNLSNLNERPDVPDGCGEISLVFWPSLNSDSRSKRASEAADMLNSAALAIREHLEAVPDLAIEGIFPDGTEAPDTSEWEELADKLENDASELEGVEFPGMYG
jgi:hypothetical protein